MEIKDLDKIKVLLLDFDDTLAIHKDKDYVKKRKENEEYYDNYFLNAYLYPDTFYDEIEVCTMSQSIYKLIKYLKERNVKIYCLSGMKFAFHVKAKENYIHKHYDEDIELLTAFSQPLKINATRIVKKINNCNYDEILFVDDMIENIENFKKIGINAMLPEEVDELFEL